MNDFLKEGEQTRITKNISNIADIFKESNIDLVFEVLTWIHKNLKQTQDQDFKKEFFRKRTASEIIESKKLTGCTDYTLVFTALMRANGISTKYIETIRDSWLEKGDLGSLEGHVFSEVFIDEKWYIVDPQMAIIKAWYGKRFHVIGEGMDSWDIGIKDIEDLKKDFSKFREDYNK